MSLETTGKLIVKYDTQVVNDRFKKREFVIEIAEEINGQTYTNYGKFQLTQTRCDILDKYNVGDMLLVKFNIKGNKWERDGKVNYISNLEAWRVEGTAQTYAPVQSEQFGGTSQQNYAQASQGHSYNPAPENVDDLPF